VLQELGYRIDTDPWAARQSLDAFVDDFRVTAGKRAEAVLHLMDSEAWEFFMVVFMETDRLHHFMWQYMESGDPTYAPKFMDAYRQIDEIAGRIIGRLRDDDELIIMSDHGFTTLLKEVYLNVWLEQQGYLQFEEGNVKGLESMTARTRAYSLDPGRVYVNLQGREPSGTVLPDDLNEVLTELEGKLRDLRDPETGKPIVKDVFRADDIYHGPLRGRAPDVLVMPHDGYDIKGSFDSSELTGRGKLVGMHKYDNATLFVRNRKLTVDHASVHDVLPTACKLLQMDCPKNVDGRVVIAG
jgi:predicted AlkP superfamily phosphohydrolase/phosphomutase